MIEKIPKIALNFCRVVYSRLDDTSTKILNTKSAEFLKLIPVNITKQTNRMNRNQSRSTSPKVLLRGGEKVTISSLLNHNHENQKHSKHILDRDSIDSVISNSNTDHNLRKVKISATIHSELINIFSRKTIPKIISQDHAFWSITEVALTDSYERIDIKWCLSPGVSHEQYFEPISSKLFSMEGFIRHALAIKINLKKTPTFSERTKSYYLYQKSLAHEKIEHLLVLKTVENDSKQLLSAKLNTAPPNFEFTIKVVAKFTKALGFIHFKNNIFIIFVDKSKLISENSEAKIYNISSVRTRMLSETPITSFLEEELNSLISYLNSGFFYYSENIDIALNMQCKEQISKDVRNERHEIFIWNMHLLEPILSLMAYLPIEQQQILERIGIFANISKGYFGTSEITIPYGRFSVSVYTRLGRKKTGTRFNSRGLDDEGNVSIFGETEIIISSEKLCFSYVILRGSVPVFWEQQGIQIGYPRIQITRAPIATQPSFERHFEALTEHHGLIHVLNLLSTKEGSVELLLTEAFEYHLNNSTHSEQLSLTSFDLNKTIQNDRKHGLDSLSQYISRDIQVFGYFAAFSDVETKRSQKGVFRVNCLDCLDRTNIAQDFIARNVADLFFRNYLIGKEFKQIDSIRIQSIVSRLFAENGDAISLIYAGTKALKTSITRNGYSGFSDYLSDFKKSATRLYCGNVTDKAKQEALDYILSNTAETAKVEFFNPVSKIIQSKLSAQKELYLSYKKLNVAALTWNTGGVSALNFCDYYVDFNEFLVENTDIYVLCLQEIVQLNATQIVSSDPEKRLLWETVFIELLDDFHGKGEFVSLVSNQLVGTSISVFVKSYLVDEVKNVEISSLKTGLGGMAGNKGSIGVRFELFGNSFCLVGSHFTAGQNASSERLKEYFSILRDLSFSKGKRILPNNFVIWLGDFNFRNDFDCNATRELIKKGDLDKLLCYDQLLSLKSDSNLFGPFQEMNIAFAPTYKYDPGTNIYDTSEKNRTPSWTDRILFYGNRFLGHKYGRSEVDISDHKPVFLIASIEVEICDSSILQSLKHEIFDELNTDDLDVPELPPRPKTK